MIMVDMMSINPVPVTKVLLNENMEGPDTFSLARGTVSILSARCPGVKSHNEDAAAIIPFTTGSAVLVVADGMGGGMVGDQAARIAVESLKTAIESIRESDSRLRTGILNGIESANADVRRLGVGAGTTLAVVEITTEDNFTSVRPYHVGDAEIMVIGGRGKVKLQTVSHSPVGYGVEAGLIEQEAALVHDERHVVSNFVGSSNMHVAVGPSFRLARRDIVLVGSDGLFDNLSTEEIVALLARGKLPKKVQRLAGEVKQRMLGAGEAPYGKPDDLTIIAWRADQSRRDVAP